MLWELQFPRIIWFYRTHLIFEENTVGTKRYREFRLGYEIHLYCLDSGRITMTKCPSLLRCLFEISEPRGLFQLHRRLRSAEISIKSFFKINQNQRTVFWSFKFYLQNHQKLDFNSRIFWRHSRALSRTASTLSGLIFFLIVAPSPTSDPSCFISITFLFGSPKPTFFLFLQVDAARPHRKGKSMHASD